MVCELYSNFLKKYFQHIFEPKLSLIYLRIACLWGLVWANTIASFLQMSSFLLPYIHLVHSLGTSCIRFLKQQVFIQLKILQVGKLS